ncbi:hypothetical protein ACVILL_007458 [Bradyrhizobium sp. USDA 3364]
MSDHDTFYNVCYFLETPLNELARSKPSDVMSAVFDLRCKTGSTHVAFDLLSGLLNLLFGLTTLSSALLILLDVVRFRPVPTLPM